MPVVRDVDRKSVWELAAELGRIAVRTCAGTTELDALRGGTFTVERNESMR